MFFVPATRALLSKVKQKQSGAKLSQSDVEKMWKVLTEDSIKLQRSVAGTDLKTLNDLKHLRPNHILSEQTFESLSSI